MQRLTMRDVRAMLACARCGARSKRSGLTCRAPAVRGKAVCRMHGAFAGAPSGERNGAFRHGHYTLEAMAERAWEKSKLQEFRETLEAMGGTRPRD
jgi:hypothetical protein